MRPLLLLLGTFLTLSLGTWADTVTLKSGEKLEGKVTNDTDPATVTIEVKVTGSIVDERVLKRADVAKIEKVTADVTIWNEISLPALGNESLESADYVRAVGFLENFVKQYPASKYAAEAKQKAALYLEEQKRVEAGEVKLDGKWIPKKQVEEERVQILGRVLFNRMSRFATAGQLIEAMNTFVTLQTSAAGSASYIEAVALARQILPNLAAAVQQRKAQIKAQAVESKRRLDNVQGEEKKQLDALQKAAAARNLAATSAYERRGDKYLPLNPATDHTLDSIMSRINTDSSTIRLPDLNRMRTSVAATNQARKALDADDLDGAKKSLDEAGTAWSSNEAINRLKTVLNEKSRIAMVAASEAAVEAAKAAQRAAAPKPTPPPVAETAPGDNEPKKSDDSFFAKPVFWIILFFLVGLGALGMKYVRRGRIHSDEGQG